MAKEQAAEEYISLDPDDPGLDDDEDRDDNVMTDMNGRLVLKPKDKWGEQESRLVKEDEDILENFEDFTEDGRVLLGKKAEREAAARRKQDMAAQIAAAEGSASDSDSASDAERERMAAFDAQQTRHGTYGATQNATPEDPYAHLRPRTPAVISPIPTLDSVVDRLRKQVAEMQSRRQRKLAEMTGLRREKVRLAEEEVRIQKALRETAEKFAELRRERGIAAAAAPGVDTPKGLLPAPGELGEEIVEGETPENGIGEDLGMDGGGDEEDDQEDEAAATGHMGLGFGGMSAAPGLGLGSGMSGMGGRPAAEEDDW